MKVFFDLKEIKILSMDNAMLNIGKNWVITRKKGGETTDVEPVESLGDDETTGAAGSTAGVRESGAEATGGAGEAAF